MAALGIMWDSLTLENSRRCFPIAALKPKSLIPLSTLPEIAKVAPPMRLAGLGVAPMLPQPTRLTIAKAMAITIVYLPSLELR